MPLRQCNELIKALLIFNSTTLFSSHLIYKTLFRYETCHWEGFLVFLCNPLHALSCSCICQNSILYKWNYTISVPFVWHLSLSKITTDSLMLWVISGLFLFNWIRIPFSEHKDFVFEMKAFQAIMSLKNV